MPTPEARQKRLDKWALRKAILQDARDVMLFMGGLAGIAHETIIASSPRETLLLLFGAMIGIIPFLRLEDAIEKLREDAVGKMRQRQEVEPEPEDE